MATPNQATGWAALPAQLTTPVDKVVNETRNTFQGEIKRRARVAVVGALAFAALGYATMALSPLGAVFAFGASIKFAMDAFSYTTFNMKINSLIEKVKNSIGNAYVNYQPLAQTHANFDVARQQIQEQFGRMYFQSYQQAVQQAVQQAPQQAAQQAAQATR